MKPVIFDGHDVILGAPQGWNADRDGPCDGLPIMRDRGTCVSCWQPDEHERVAIAWGAPVWLRVVSGISQPPVCLSVGEPDLADADALTFPLFVRGSADSLEFVAALTRRRILNVVSFTLIFDPARRSMLARLIVRGLPDQGDYVSPIVEGEWLACEALIAGWVPA